MPLRDWALIRTNLINFYNPKVASQFGTEPTSEQQQIINQLQIKSNDSSLIAQSRITLYNQQFNSEAYAAVPEWWQIRPEAHRPQFILMCAQIVNNAVIGYLEYPITIPHPIVKHLTSSPIPDYQKGNIEGILTLNDNSKVLVNCYTEDIANNILQAIQKIIDPVYLTNSFTKVGTRKGQQLLNITVRCKQSRYFSAGMKNKKPDWIDNF